VNTLKFINREAEMGELGELEKLSKKKLFVAALYGLRRVGKTRLLLEFLGRRGMYFFVNRNKTSADLLAEYQQVLRANGVLGELETLENWDRFAETIMKRDVPPVVFDEFQNFGAVEPSIYGIMQKSIDMNEDKPGLVILSGSTIGLMKKLFKSSKEPLYGRIKQGKKLEPLSLKSCLQIGRELDLGKEELIKLYLLFGGYPRYYVAVEDFGLNGRTAEEIVQKLFLDKDAPLEDEANGILSQEFGGRSGVYYSILEAIATGNNTISAIAGYLNAPATSLTRQINELRDHFELIELERPYYGKRGNYRIRHPLMQFWFSQFYRNYSDYVARKPEFVDSLVRNLNSAYGRCFERAAREFLASELRLEDAGRQWGKIQGAEKGKNAYEIDLIGKGGGKFYAFEFKWKEISPKEAAGILDGLKEKLRYVPLAPQGARLGIVAKKIREKERMRAAGYLAYDLDDF